MKQFIRRILIAFFVVKILTVSVFPVGATNNEYVSSGSFWNWIADHGKFVQSVTGYFPGSGSCPSSEDTYHHASSYQKEGNVDGDIRYWCVCDYCHQSFTAYESDLQQSYEAQVEELPAPSYNSDGSLYIQGVHDGIRVQNAGSGIGKEGISCTHTSYLGYSGYDGVGHFNCENNSLSVVPKSGSSHFSFYYVEFLFKISSPLDGYYILMDNPSINGFMIVNDTKYDLIQYWIKNSSIFYNKGSKVSASSSAYSSKAGVALRTSCENLSHNLQKRKSV